MDNNYKNERSQELYQAVLGIIDLRKAQKTSDWDNIENILLKINQENNKNNNNSISNIYYKEIERARVEKDNHHCLYKLKTCIIIEEMKSIHTKLDIDHISIQQLQECIHNIQVLLPNVNQYNNLLKSLLQLAEFILKARKAAKQQQWYPLESLVSVLKQHLDLFQNEIENTGIIITILLLLYITIVTYLKLNIYIYIIILDNIYIL